MIEAAGGGVLRGTGERREVLVVHRPRYDDWSLPKGKLDAGEDAVAGALREVEEETGVQATPGRALPELRYRDARDRPKRVRWYVMQPTSGDPSERPADDEIDEARWVSICEASRLLTYPTEREILEHALNEPTP